MFTNISFQNDVDALNRDVSPEEVGAWCQEYYISSFIETSAKTSQNVTAAFVLAVRQWLKMERITERELNANGDTIDLTRGVRLNGNGRSCCNGNSTSATNSPHHSTRHEILQ